MSDFEDFQTFKIFSNTHTLVGTSIDRFIRDNKKYHCFVIRTPLVIAYGDPGCSRVPSLALIKTIIKFSDFCYQIDGKQFSNLNLALNCVLELFEQEGIKTKPLNSIDFIKN